MAKDRAEEERIRPKRRVNASKGTADWTSCDPQLLVRAVARVAINGGALRLGYTSDGGAYAIGVYGDGSPYTDYVKPNDDIDSYLTDIYDAWE